MFKLKRLNAWNALQRQSVIPFPQTVTQDMKNGGQEQLTVVAFHTDDDFYTAEAQRMRASAQRLDMDVDITVISNQGDWVKNTSMKAGFLAKVRQRIRGPILYVDVDSVFHRSPAAYLTQLDCDIAVHYDDADGHLMSGTLYFPDTPTAAQLLNEWAEQSRLQEGVWDQKVLENLLIERAAQSDGGYRVHSLPVVFCWVFDREANIAHRDNMPVYIEQLQASREVRDEVRRQSKKRLFWRQSSKTQRRLERIVQIEKILFK